jgi:hypothetical protein
MTNDPREIRQETRCTPLFRPPSVLSERSWIACLIADNGA